MATKTKKKRRRSATKKRSKKFNMNHKIFIPVVAAVLVIAVALMMIFIDKPSARENPFENINAEYVNGIDVSHHNGKIHWKTVRDSIDFAIVRVGARGYVNGNIIEDRTAEANLKGANKAGVPIGAYFYTQAVTPEEAEEEAKYVLKVIKGYDVSLPVFIDFEYAYNKKGEISGRLYKANLTKEENTEIINAFCRVIEKAGYQSGVYASTYIYESHLVLDDLNKDCFIWVADYNKNISYKGKYDIWQYSDKGRLKGVGSKNVDLNHWYLKG